MTKQLFAPFLLTLAVSVSASEAPDQVIDCAQVLDVRAGASLGPHTITVRDGRIVTLKLGTADNATVTLSNGVCAPGFIDLHTHLRRHCCT